VLRTFVCRLRTIKVDSGKDSNLFSGRKTLIEGNHSRVRGFIKLHFIKCGCPVGFGTDLLRLQRRAAERGRQHLTWPGNWDCNSGVTRN
jgi:hypothetical protein